MKIVVDTNILISAIYFGGLPKELVKLIASQKIDAYANNDIIREYIDTIAKFPDQTTNNIFLNLIHCFHIVETQTKINLCRDPKDNMFINCAIDSKSIYIVSGDKDLLSIEKVEGVLIVTVRDFLKAYNMQKYN